MLLALPWRKYSIHELEIDGRRINLVETTNDPRGTGLIAWDGAFVLGKFLEKTFGSQGLKGQSVIELGSGTGLAGLCAAALGAEHLFLTDLEYALDNLRANVDANLGLKSNVICAELDWYHPSLDFLQNHFFVVDVIILADVAWVPELVSPLVNTLRIICDSSCCVTVPKIFLAHQTRALRTDELLMNELKSQDFDIIKAQADEYAEGYSGSVFVYKIVSNKSRC